MSNISSVTIDAGVLAVPPSTCSINDAYHYVDALLDWSKLLDESWVAIYMSERASEVLFADDLFPLRDQLRELFNTHGIVEFDVNTVAKIANKLLAITPSFETYFRVKDVLVEQILTFPNLIQLNTHDGLQTDLARCLVLIAILRKHCLQPIGGHSLILREAPRKVIQVMAQIHDLEHERYDIPFLPSPPEFFEGDVLVCDDFKGLIECLDESAILVDSTDDIGIQLSIKFALYKYATAHGEDPDWADIFAPIIGSEFRHSCQRCCADKAASLPSSILRAIVETVRGENLQAVHALREGKGGNAPQRMRGNDKAVRRDIDYEIHLHYWSCDKKSIELASVVYHNDISIPE